jgi:heat shock protein 5
LKNKTIIIYDLGGGTFDVSVVKVNDGQFRVLSTAGDTHLGGEDFDQLITDDLAERFLKKNKNLDIDFKTNPRALIRLKTEVERAKRDLSEVQAVKINIESFI